MYFVGIIQRKLKQRSRGWTPAMSSVSQPGSDGIPALVLQPSVTSHGDSVLQHLSACLVTGALLTEVTPEILGGRVLPEACPQPEAPIPPIPTGHKLLHRIASGSRRPLAQHFLSRCLPRLPPSPSSVQGHVFLSQQSSSLPCPGCIHFSQVFPVFRRSCT